MVDANPFVVVPLETVDVSSPLPKELCPVPAPAEARRSRPPAKPAAASEQEQDHQGVLDSVVESVNMEETEDVPKKKRPPAKSRARPPQGGGAPRAVREIEHSVEPRDSAPVGASAPPAPAQPAEVLVPEQPPAVTVAPPAVTVTPPAPEAPPAEPAARSAAARRGRPQGARNKPRPAIIERVIERIEPPALSVEDIRKLLQESIRKQELEARSQKRAHYAQLLRANR